MREILELNEFFVEGRDKKKSHALLHISEPSTPEEYKKGYFFAMAEIKNGTTEQIEHLQQMIDDLETSYYETNSQGETNAFEIALEYVNRRGHHVLQNSEAELHCLAGSIVGGEITFAYHGKPEACVFYQTKNGSEMISIIDQNETVQNNQLFSSLLQGEIHSGDFFYISSFNVGQYFSRDRIQKIIASRPLTTAAEYIQKILTDLRSDESYAGILFHLMPQTEAPKTGPIPNYRKRGSAVSLDRLLDAEKNTRDTLSPPLIENTAKKIKNLWEDGNFEESGKMPQKIETNFRSSGERKRPKNIKPSGHFLVVIGKAIVFILQAILFVLKRILVLFKNILVGLFIITFNKGNQRVEAINEIRRSYRQKKEAIFSLSLISKTMLLLAIVFSIMFIGSITYYKIKATNESRHQEYLNQIKNIYDKINTANGNLIYENNTKAFEEINQAKELLAQLPEGSKEEKTKKQELTGEIESTLFKLRKIEVVSPTLIADLKKFRPEALTDKLAMIDDNLIAYGANDEYLYSINGETGTVEAKLLGVVKKLSAAATPKENDFVLFISGTDQIASLDKSSLTVTSKDISFPFTEVNLTDLVIYNRRVYSLDAKNNQIWKHGPTQTGYDRGSAWIKSLNANLSDAISMAVDGDIFVLKKNGEIAKFVDGQQQEFPLLNIDPVLTNPVRLYTYNGFDYIYILEPTNKRLVIIDKTGKMVKQYTADEWIGPTGFQVDEKKQRVYILDDNKIYIFNTTN